MKFISFISLFLLSLSALAQPANDLCTNATATVADGTCYTTITTAATDNISAEAGCATQGGPNAHRDVWFTFSPTTTTVDFDITSPCAGCTIELLLISGTCAALVLENSTCQTSPLSATFAGLTIGQTYFYVVSFPANTQSTITSCVTSVASPPESGQNCSSAVPICSNSSFGGNSDGFGVQELNNANHGCLASNEQQSSWYYFQIQTTGTLDMTIDPSGTTDYDYALWGPLANHDCPVSGTPVRCSYASGTATLVNTGSLNTGIGPPGTEPTDGTGGTLNGWTSSLNVTAGEFYILLIDNFSADNTPFNLSWGGSSVLSCALLPIDLVAFEATVENGFNHITWQTASENNNRSFTIEHSTDAQNFKAIEVMDGAGTSNEEHSYMFNDHHFIRQRVNYYRLRQTDFNGAEQVFNIVAANNVDERIVVKRSVYDLLGKRYEDANTPPGLYFIITEYNDGMMETKKEWRQ